MKAEIEEPVTESYIGLVLRFNEPKYNRRKSSYKDYAETIRPFVEEFNRLGLEPLNDQRIRKIYSGSFKYSLTSGKRKPKNPSKM